MAKICAFLLKPVSLLRRKVRHFQVVIMSSSPGMLNRIVTLHPQFYLFMLLMISYTILITVFHLYDIRLIIQAIPGRPYVNKFQNLGHYPVFSNDSHCKGCERLKLNGHAWKVISTIDFLILVPSATTHFEQRQRVRRTWGQAQSSYRDKRVLFFLGTAQNESIEAEIFKENYLYGDIVQADFIDSYYNLTYKTLSMLYWTHFRMSDGRFRPKWIFKCDDDNFVDIFAFEKYLHTYDNLKGDHLICSKREEAVPSRIDPNNTWYVNFDTWPEPLWPPCCFGPAYVISPSAVSRLLEAHEAAKNPFIPFEDIYVTGVLARAAGVTLINYEDRIFTNYLGVEKVIVHKGLSHWNPAYIEEKWEETVITAYGNTTFQKLKAELKERESEKTRVAEAKAAEIKRLIEKKRVEYEAAKQHVKKREVTETAAIMDPEEEKILRERLKKQEEALKKPQKNLRPYAF